MRPLPAAAWFLDQARAGSRLEHSLIKDRVYMLSRGVPLSVDLGTPVGDVMRTMVDRAIGCIVVVAQGEMVGIFTDAMPCCG